MLASNEYMFLYNPTLLIFKYIGILALWSKYIFKYFFPVLFQFLPKCQFLSAYFPYFHKLGPLGQLGLLVVMSICMCVCNYLCMPPHPLTFFFVFLTVQAYLIGICDSIFKGQEIRCLLYAGFFLWVPNIFKYSLGLWPPIYSNICSWRFQFLMYLHIC